MASQYSTFAELFDDAIKSGLSAIQTQHPGYFFHLAAKQTIERRTACNELCKVMIVLHIISFFKLKMISS